MSEKAAGWYPDPSGKNQQRFWDGDGWTEYYQPLLPAHAPVHDASTATADYPYLSGNTGAMSTPHIPPPQGWSKSTNDWATPQQSTPWAAPAPTTAWGTPAAPHDYAGGDDRPAQTWDPDAGTQVYRSGSQGSGNNRSGRGGLIAVVVASCLVVGLLVVGGIMAFRDGDEAASSPSRDVEEGVVDVGEVAQGSAPGNGEWVGALRIDDGGAYVVDARSTGSDDLQMGVRDSDGTTLAYNDDRGALLRMGAERLDPLVVLDLVPGEYEVVVSEYWDDSADFTVEVRQITEEIGLDQAITVDLAQDEGYLAVLQVQDDAEVVIDVRAQDEGDPTLVVRSLERDAMWSDDDRGGDDNPRDPLLDDLELPAGNYAIIVTEYFGDPMSVQIDVSTR